MELRGSKTEKNLWEAFAGESQARNKYTFFASKAKKEGYEQLAAIFTETANNEKEHAKIWFKLLMENGEIPDTLTCLKMAAAGLDVPAHGRRSQGGGLYPDRRAVHDGGRYREGPRGTLQAAGRQYRGRQGLRPRDRAGLAVPQLRVRLYRSARAAQVPGVRTSAELF